MADQLTTWLRQSKGGKDFGAWGVGPNAYRQTTPLDFSGFPGQPAGTPRQMAATKPAAAAPVPSQQAAQPRVTLPQLNQLARQFGFRSFAQAFGIKPKQARTLAAALSTTLQAGGQVEVTERPDARGATKPTAAINLTGNGPYPLNPLGIKYEPLGTPGQGTHSTSEGPDNWQSDNAWDYGAPAGTPVYAVSAGVVGDRYGQLASSGRFGGNRLNILGSRNQWYYAHLGELVVRPGQQVKRGQLLGYIGDVPGLTPHLHFGVMSPPATPN